MGAIARKGVILAGGAGTRLKPLTYFTNKHLIRVFDKMMVLFPLATLKDIGASDICLVTGYNYVEKFRRALGNGKKYGVSLTYRSQDAPRGLAHAVLQAEDFSKGHKVAVILGDDFFGRVKVPEKAFNDKYAYVCVNRALDPAKVAIVEFDTKGNIVGIEEKPKKPKSDFEICGLYIYPPDVFNFIKKLKPSKRGELEITDVNKWYLKRGLLRPIKIDSLIADGGNFKSLAKLWTLRIKQLVTRSKYMDKSIA